MLTYGEWLDLSGATTVIDHVMKRRDLLGGSGDLGAPRVELTDDDQQLLRDAVDRVKKSSTALERIASGVTAGIGL
jgi:hypothetical protein